VPSLFGYVIRPLAKDVVAEQFVLMKDFLKGKVIPIKDGCWISVSNRRADLCMEKSMPVKQKP
jgi:hypothetical protein